MSHMVVIVSGALFLIAGVYFLGFAKGSGRWSFWATLSLLFLVYSGYVVDAEGLLGFLNEHVRSHWSNQIWFDLLLAAFVGWLALLPRARKLNLKVALWFGLIAATGSIGLLGFFSRILYLESRSSEANK